MTKIKTLVPVKQLSKFEKQNPEFSVNLYGLFGKSKQDRENKVRVYPMYTSPHRNKKYHANLLLVKNKEKSHYVAIKSLSRLLCGQTTYKNKMYVCKFCLFIFEGRDMCQAWGVL